MNGAKEQFLEMRQKEWFVVMPDEIYMAIGADVRKSLKNATVGYTGEHGYLYGNDPEYRETYKTYKEAKAILDEKKHQLRERLRREKI